MQFHCHVDHSFYFFIAGHIRRHISNDASFEGICQFPELFFTAGGNYNFCPLVRQQSDSASPIPLDAPKITTTLSFTVFILSAPLYLYIGTAYCALLYWLFISCSLKSP